MELAPVVSLIVLCGELGPLQSRHVLKDALPPTISKLRTGTSVAIIDVECVIDFYVKKRYANKFKRIGEEYRAKAEKATPSNRTKILEAGCEEIISLGRQIRVDLRSDIDKAVRKIAEVYGFQLVLNYKLSEDSPSLASRCIIRSAISDGGSAPLYLNGNMNITWFVINNIAYPGEMERWRLEEKKLHDAKPALDSPRN